MSFNFSSTNYIVKDQTQTYNWEMTCARMHWNGWNHLLFLLIKNRPHLDPMGNNNNSFICMTEAYYRIAKAYNSTKIAYNVIIIIYRFSQA